MGVGWPLAYRLALTPAEKLLAAAVLSLLIVFLIAWVIYVTGLPIIWLRTIPATAALGLITGHRSLSQTLEDPAAVRLVVGQIMITTWSVAGLALIISYSGGNWVADWFGHQQRTWFFLERGPVNILFNGFDPVTSRPPLANIVNGVFLTITQRDFSHYQIFGTLFGSLVFLPAGLFTLRFGKATAIPGLVLLFMVNPMYAENATYAWTKLQAAFFILSSLYFYLRATADSGPRIYAVLFAAALGAALLTHYSAGPYAVLMGGMWFLMGRSRWSDMNWWKTTAALIFTGLMVLCTWFGWAFAIYGVRGSLMTTTSVAGHISDVVEQLRITGLNLRDTLVPHFFRHVDLRQLAQRSSLGWWRDYFFLLYQLNFFLSFGSVAWLVILSRLPSQWENAPGIQRCFWTVFIVGNIVLGVGVLGEEYVWGLSHICMQPLVLLGLAFLAANWSRLRKPWRLFLIAGATLDFVLGIFLQFGVQSYLLERWFTGDRPIPALVASYSIQTRMNFGAKVRHQWVFVGDVFFKDRTLVVVGLALLFLIALWLASRESANSFSAGEKP